MRINFPYRWQGLGHYEGAVSLVPTILAFFPPHERYVEPFVGGANVFVAKLPSSEEIINDISPFYSNWLRLLKRTPAPKIWRQFNPMKRPTLADFARLLKLVKERKPLPDLWSYHVHRLSSPFATIYVTAPPERMKYWERRVGDLQEHGYRWAHRYIWIHFRLRDAQIKSQNALDLFNYDSSDTLYFLDPPYWGEKSDPKNMTKRFTAPSGTLDAIFTEDEFIEALSSLKRAKVIILLDERHITLSKYRKLGYRVVRVQRLSVTSPVENGRRPRKTSLLLFNFEPKKTYAYLHKDLWDRVRQ